MSATLEFRIARMQERRAELFAGLQDLQQRETRVTALRNLYMPYLQHAQELARIVSERKQAEETLESLTAQLVDATERLEEKRSKE